MSDISNQALKSFIEKLEYINEQKAGLGEDFKEVLKSAEGAGFEPKIIRKLIKKRAEDQAKAAEEQATLELYEAAIGPLKGTPLGQAAMSKVA